MLVLDAAWQNTYAGPVVIYCNILFVILTFAEFCEVHVVLAIAFFQEVLYCTPSRCFYSHPSRCFVVCILRGAFFMHPSRCFVVCILRGALLYVEKMSTILLLLLPDELSAIVMFRKTSPPFLALGSLGP